MRKSDLDPGTGSRAIKKQIKKQETEFMKKANRPKGRDAKLRGLTPQGHDSPAASVSPS